MARAGVLVLFLILGQKLQSLTVEWAARCGVFLDTLIPAVLGAWDVWPRRGGCLPWPRWPEALLCRC